MSDSELEYYQPTVTAEQKTKVGRKSSANNNGKRQSQTSSTSRPSKMASADSDLFGISKRHGSDVEFEEGSSGKITCLSSYFVNRVANGCERCTASTNGEYYIDCKVYKGDDARTTESLELWRKALVRIKFQTDTDSPQ